MTETDKPQPEILIEESVVRELLHINVQLEKDVASHQLKMLDDWLRIAESSEQAEKFKLTFFELALLDFSKFLLWRADHETHSINVFPKLLEYGASTALLATASEVTKQWKDLEFVDVDRLYDDAMLRLGLDLSTPAFNAWDAVHKGLWDLLQKPEVQANPEAVAFAEKCLEMARSSSGRTTAEQALALLRQEGRSQSARNAAQMKNQVEREWVRKQWESRQDLSQSKNSFAAQYRHLVKHQFGKDVTAETIKSWLPKIS